MKQNRQEEKLRVWATWAFYEKWKSVWELCNQWEPALYPCIPLKTVFETKNYVQENIQRWSDEGTDSQNEMVS